MNLTNRTMRFALGPIATWLAGGSILAGTVDETAYFSPSAVCLSSGGETLYVAGTTADAVAVFDLDGGRVKQVWKMPGSPGDVVLSPDGTRLYVAIEEPAGRVVAVDTVSGDIVKSMPVGHTPSALEVSPEGTVLYVCNRFDNNVAFHDLESGAVIGQVGVTREPVAVVLSKGGEFLFVANHLPAGAADGAFTAAELSVIDTASKSVLASVPLHNGSTGVNGLCLSPDGKHVYIAHTIGRYHVPATQLERGWVNTNALSIVDAVGHKLVNAVLLDNIDRGAANPWGVACTEDGKYVCVTLAGSHEVSVIDREALHRKLAENPAEDIPNDLSFLVGLRRRVQLSGLGPHELAVVGTRLYTAEYFSDSIGVVDVCPDGPAHPLSVPLGTTKPMDVVRRGEFLFKDATWCFQQWQSCASCHPSDRADALNWDLLNDGLGTPKNTKSLVLSHQTPPTTVTGVRANAETSVRSGIRFFMAVLPESDAVALDTYIKSFKPVPSPHLVDGKLSSSALRGQKIFEAADCISCHKPPLYTNQKLVDVGTGRGLEEGRRFDVPSLIEAWRTAPYLHDGRAATLREVVTQCNPDDEHGDTSHLSPDEISDLIEFVSSL